MKPERRFLDVVMPRMSSLPDRLRFVARLAAVACGLLLLAADGERAVVEDEYLHFELPDGWTATGEGGEYWLDGEQDVASLLLLPPDPVLTLEARLAEIEEQFLSTGVIERESSETREIDGNLVHVRRYRLASGGGDGGPILLHQYSFVRSAVRVLLQVETSERGGDEDTLFRSIYETLSILRAPGPPPAEGESDADSADAWAEPDGFEAIVDSSDAEVYEPADPEAGK